MAGDAAGTKDASGVVEAGESEPSLALMPRDRLEAGVIGAMLVSADACFRCCRDLIPDHFLDPRARIAFQVIVERYDVGDQVDLVVVHEDLLRAGKLDQAGGNRWLEWATEVLSTPSLASVYCRQLDQRLVDRRLESASRQAREFAAAGKTSEAVAVLQRASEIRPRTAMQPDRKTIIRSTWEHMQQEKDSDLSFSTGLPSVDNAIGGIHRGRVYTIVADTGRGKSAMALQWAYAIASAGHRVHYWSREMPAEECYRRIAGQQTGVSVAPRAARTWNDDERAILQQTMRYLETIPLTVDHTTSELGSMLMQARRHRGEVGFYVLDHIQLVKVRGCDQIEPRIARIADESKGTLALECGAAVLMISQQKRTTEEHYDPLHSGKGSSAVEHDSDVFAEIWQSARVEECQRRRPVELRIHKHRFGRPAAIPLVFAGHLVRFEESAKDGDE